MAEKQNDQECEPSDTAVKRLSPLPPGDPVKDQITGLTAGATSSPTTPRRSPTSRLHMPSKSLQKVKQQEPDECSNVPMVALPTVKSGKEGVGGTHEFQELRSRLRPILSADGQPKPEMKADVRRGPMQG